MQKSGSRGSQISQEDAALLIIPAIDLKGGKCVRLWRGVKSRETIYSQDPVAIARKWIEEGAPRLHIVDLDGAFSGYPRHLGIAEKIKKNYSIPVQYGGGIRQIKLIRETLKRGIDYVILGTRALSFNFIKKAVDEFGEKIIVSIDCKQGKLAIKGWEVETSVKPKELAKRLASIGVITFILTDITKDGTLEGVNITFIEHFIRELSSNLIVAGGISTVEDIKKIGEIGKGKIKGVIIGKALYEGTIKLKEAIKVAGEKRDGNF